MHGIPDGSEVCDPSEPLRWWIWLLDDGVNILGTPLGSQGFEEEYLNGKGLKHRLLLSFIKEVANVGFQREAIEMLKGAAIHPEDVPHTQIDQENR